MKYKAVKIWLWIGVAMVFFQVVIGGITRLTGSGLSITKWEIVTGTLPPLNAEDWNAEFNLYKATPQYELINEGMSMSEFKFIYFWEYIHRLWARTMGFVFLFPFIYFLIRKRLSKQLVYQLLGVVGLAAVVASFGWIMVASGLIDKPWVNPTKLTMHLNLALILFAFLSWVTANYTFDQPKIKLPKSTLKVFVLCCAVIFAQLILGGLMSGMKAGLDYPTYPLMRGELIPSLVYDGLPNSTDFANYDTDPQVVAKTWVQFLHRFTAIAVIAVVVWLLWTLKDAVAKHWLYLVGGTVAVQFALGIFTVVQCKGSIPLTLGVLHQAGAVTLILVLMCLLARLKWAKQKATFSLSVVKQNQIYMAL